MSLLHWVLWWASGTTPNPYVEAPQVRTFYPHELSRTMAAPMELNTFYAHYDATLDGEPGER